jgi:acylphosphatase
MPESIRFFLARGNVQGVMFRQTLIRGAQKRALRAGASNLPSGREVAITLEGGEGVIHDLVESAMRLDPLNSWGARIDDLTEQDEGRPIEEHQVTTENVDRFSWNPNVEMFL